MPIDVTDPGTAIPAGGTLLGGGGMYVLWRTLEALKATLADMRREFRGESKAVRDDVKTLSDDLGKSAASQDKRITLLEEHRTSVLKKTDTLVVDVSKNRDGVAPVSELTKRVDGVVTDIGDMRKKVDAHGVQLVRHEEQIAGAQAGHVRHSDRLKHLENNREQARIYDSQPPPIQHGSG